jgi:putative ABC transport system permease protein
VERAREVGVRKVIGAGQGQLFRQFIGESTILCLLSVLLSLGVVALALPAFNTLTDRSLPLSSLFSFGFIAIALATAFILSLLAGAYPALILSRFQPVKVLKGAFKNTRSGQGLRRSLIVFQFVISVFLIVCTLIMQGQLSYIQNIKLGYNREHVLVLPMSWSMLPRFEFFKTQLLSDPDIVSLSHASNTPVSIEGGYNMRSATMPSSQQMNVRANPIDEDYLRTSGIQLVAGEDLTMQDLREANPEFFGEKDATKRFFHFILNESAAKALGWKPREAIGKRMFLDDSRPGIVKGVVRDFHFEDLHHVIQPLVLFPEMRGGRLMARISGEHMSQTIAFLKEKYKALEPSIPFEYRFLDEDYNQLYHSEQRLCQVMNVFSLIAIVLACLGLFGLSSYAARQRVKEIGIRKVLGASLPNLVMVMSSGFLRMAGVAILIAFPISWWAMHKWLNDFVYRKGMDWGAFLWAGLAVMLIAMLTVSFEAVRTALLNPVKNLKVE